MNKIDNKSGDHKFFLITPQIVWAYSKDPYEYVLWCVIKNVAGDSGECFLSTDDLASLSMMSTGKVSQCRKSLIDTGLLQGEVRKDPGYPQPVWHLKIPDIWAANLEWAMTNSSLKAKVEFKKTQSAELQAIRLSLHQVKAKNQGDSPSNEPKEPSPGEGGATPGETGTSPNETGISPNETNKNENNNQIENREGEGDAIVTPAQPSPTADQDQPPLSLTNDGAINEQPAQPVTEKPEPAQPQLVLPLGMTEDPKDFAPPTAAPPPACGGAPSATDPYAASLSAKPGEYMPGVPDPRMRRNAYMNQPQATIAGFIKEARELGITPEQFRLIVDAVLEGFGKNTLADSGHGDTLRKGQLTAMSLIRIPSGKFRTPEAINDLFSSWWEVSHWATTPPSEEQLIAHAGLIDTDKIRKKGTTNGNNQNAQTSGRNASNVPGRNYRADQAAADVAYRQRGLGVTPAMRHEDADILFG